MRESRMFGHKLEDFTHEELIAIAAVGWHNYNVLKKEKQDAEKLFSEMDKKQDDLWNRFDKIMSKRNKKHGDDFDDITYH